MLALLIVIGGALGRRALPTRPLSAGRSVLVRHYFLDTSEEFM
jgi:hypothetical protein